MGLDEVRSCGGKDWSDEVEAIDQLLSAADILNRSRGARRMLARDLSRRRATASDVLTWLVWQMVEKKRTTGWMSRVLRADPETVWRALGSGAEPLTAGRVNHLRREQVTKLVARLLVGRVVPDSVRVDARVMRALLYGQSKSG